MKKILFLCFLILTIGTMMLSAEDVSWGSYYGEKNVLLGIDLNLETNGSDKQIALAPGAEMVLWKPMMGDLAFIDVGAAVRGRFGLPVTGGRLSAGAGLLGTMHIGFRGLELPASEYLQRIDIFAEAGVKFDLIRDVTVFGFALKSGLNYFFNEKMSAGIHYSTWGDYSGAGLSLAFKFGKTPVVKGIDLDFSEELSGFAVQPYLLQFYTLYYSANFAGGFYPGNFKEGQGCAYRISTIDESGEISYVVEKAYLEAVGKNSRLWSLKYDDGDDSFYYEYITDEDGYIQTVFYRPENEDVLTLDAGDAVNPEPNYMGWEDYPVESRKNVSIDVEAGRFKTTEYTYISTAEADVMWWISEDVPGNLVSYKMEDDSDIVISELIDISSRNKAKLYK